MLASQSFVSLQQSTEGQNHSRTRALAHSHTRALDHIISHIISCLIIMTGDLFWMYECLITGVPVARAKFGPCVSYLMECDVRFVDMVDTRVHIFRACGALNNVSTHIISHFPNPRECHSGFRVRVVFEVLVQHSTNLWLGNILSLYALTSGHISQGPTHPPEEILKSVS